MKKSNEALNEKIYKQFQKGLDFNNRIDLCENVETSENFFIGRQWEGVQANGLPTPVYNFLKRIVLHQVANITSDNITMNAKPLAAAPNDREMERVVSIVNEEFIALMEHNRIPNMTREYMRNAAVDGDGCTYTYWDPDAVVSKDIRGTIRTTVIENTRVFFGNPNSRDVQTQPWIIISRRDFVKAVKKYARENSISEENAELIRPDTDENNSLPESYVDNRCTVLLKLWRDDETKTIWAAESNSPRTLHGQDCYEWSNVSRYSSNLSSDERQAKRISDRVYETLSGMDAERCVCWDDDYSQQYFIAFGKTALVHNYAADAWYYYSNFDAVCFLSFRGELYFGTSGGELRKLDDGERSIAGEEIDAYWESGSIDFGEDFRRKYIAQIWVGLKPTENSEVIVTVQTDRKSVYAEKVVQRKMASFANADFTDWSFETNYKPFMQRLKIKAKKVTYYKMVFKSRSDTTGATVVALDMRVRYNGYVK